LFANGTFMADINIKCGIFQGDCISPLLFCLALNPLSEVIGATKFGIRLSLESPSNIFCVWMI